MAKELPVVAVIKQQLSALKRELAVDIPRALEEARAHGDLKENAEYHAAKERQGMLTARIEHLTARLADLGLYSLSSIPRDVVGYGSRVVVEDLDSGESQTYELVFAEESQPAKGLISIGSPIGQALLKRAEGDEIAVQTPSGKKSLEVLSVTTIHDILGENDGN